MNRVSFGKVKKQKPNTNKMSLNYILIQELLQLDHVVHTCAHIECCREICILDRVLIRLIRYTSRYMLGAHWLALPGTGTS